MVVHVEVSFAVGIKITKEDRDECSKVLKMIVTCSSTES